MKNTRIFLLSVLCFMALTPIFSQDITEREEIRSTYILKGSEQKRLYLDNMEGSIDVKGYDGNEIQLIVKKEITAESRGKVQEAKEEVLLDIKEEPNKLLIYIDAPWRRSDGSMNYRGYEYYGYVVRFDFELRVPRKMDLYLKTVNEGTLRVENVEGELQVKNVNEGIEMVNVAGSAKVSTVNGPIKVSFTKNPESDCSFATVNGKVEVELQEGLSANLDLRTFNGEVYTDFEFQSMPRKREFTERKKRGRRIYSRGDSFSAQIGDGGPWFSFNTLNGDIFIIKQK